MEASSIDPPGHRVGTLGFIGLGAMGKPMARHLASLGYDVLVHDTNAEAVRSVVEAGASAARSPKAIASEAEVVFTCLPSLDALRAVVLGPDGLHAGTAIRFYIDLSTTGVSFAKEIAGTLRNRDILMLDSPITGNVTTAGNGKLGIMCSGPQAAFARVQPVLNDLASTCVLYLGEETGKAQRLKSLNNLLSATGMAASCEAFILGVKGGLDPKVMLDVVNAGEASSSATRNKFAHSVLSRQFGFGARMAITSKDISTTVAESEELGIPMWIGQSVRQIWKYAVSQGGGDKDGTALITFLEPWASVTVSSDAGLCAHQADTVAPGPTASLVLLCRTSSLTPLADRLRGQGWMVDILAGAQAKHQISNSDDNRDRRCILVGASEGDDLVQLVTSRLPLQPEGAVILNTCLMHSTEAARLAETFSTLGHFYLDALLSGQARYSEAADRRVLASGPASTVRFAKPIIDAIGCAAVHVSEHPGAAHLMHQINGALFSTLLAVSCEAYVVGAKAGLDPTTMTKILGIETGKNIASAKIIPEQVATRTFDYGKSIEESHRELCLLSDEAGTLGVTPWILDKTRLLFGLAAQLGSPSDDVTRIITHYEKWGDTEVRSESTEATR